LPTNYQGKLVRPATAPASEDHDHRKLRLGVGVGTIIRNQAGAIIAVLILLYVAEPLLGFIPHIGAAIQEYGLGGLASGATGTAGFPSSAHLLGQIPAVLVIACYALTTLLLATFTMRRRDITA